MPIYVYFTIQLNDILIGILLYQRWRVYFDGFFVSFDYISKASIELVSDYHWIPEISFFGGFYCKTREFSLDLLNRPEVFRSDFTNLNRWRHFDSFIFDFFVLCSEVQLKLSEEKEEEIRARVLRIR